MKQTILFSIICFLSVATFAAPKKLVLTSPDGTVAVEASLNPSGTLIYEIKKNGATVIEPSKMGLDGDFSFVSGLKIASVSKSKLFTESYYSPNEKTHKPQLHFSRSHDKTQKQSRKNAERGFSCDQRRCCFPLFHKSAQSHRSKIGTNHFPLQCFGACMASSACRC